MQTKTINAPEAPDAVGPYSHAVATGGLIFCSGQLPINPSDGVLLTGSPSEQADRCLQNLEAVAHAAGGSLRDAVRVTVYLTDMGSFAEVNEVYARYFEQDPPARVAIGVASLPKGAAVEMDAVLAVTA